LGDGIIYAEIQKLNKDVLKRGGVWFRDDACGLSAVRGPLLLPAAGASASSLAGAASSRVYVVKEGDSLWGIAQRELGSGIRHVEISELNAKRFGKGQKLQPALNCVCLRDN
jgi:hypothetical protein